MQRTIKSFVMRAGRISNRQQQGLDQSLKAYKLSLGEAWDLAAIFGREAETVVEIGFGMGKSLLTMALQQPEVNFIGIEVHRAGLGALAADLCDHAVQNVRVVNGDAVMVFKHQLANDSLAGVQIFFPDPWPKKRHHKRRLLQTDFAKLILERVKLGGFIHCATDWQEYAEHIKVVMDSTAGLANSEAQGGFSPRPQTRPLTKFEQRGQRLGHGVWDLVYIKKNELSEAD
ncbi:MAG: tRNA (guanosine(46)-N7)-methyltransferase TrmB [Tatlockia sp.]|nr:tRNA (guanosine(46)-N7)-methyltransferase TrmB [Tatlockia sp.]